MTIHTPHPGTHEHGLADDCPRCAEHAEHPVLSLDDTNLRRLMEGIIERVGLYTHTDEVAAARLRTDLEHAGHLARAAPDLFFRFLDGYGVRVERYASDVYEFVDGRATKREQAVARSVH